MGEIYLAQDTRLNRKVAIKLLPERYTKDPERLRRFEWDPSTVKLSWALDGPVPWSAADARRSGTVHLGVDVDGFVEASAALSTGRRPERPFVVLGQMGVARGPAYSPRLGGETEGPERPGPRTVPVLPPPSRLA